MLLDVESQVFSRIVSDFPQTILTKYDMTVDDNFSTEGTSNTDSVFPFVYLHLLAPVEVGGDMEGTSINGVNATLQVDVYDSDSPSTAKEIMDAIVSIFKGMSFRSNQLPEFYYGTTMYRQTARFSRYIGSDDSL